MPSKLFNSEYYLKLYPDVSKSKLDPFVHYTKYGINEGRTCTFDFVDLTFSDVKTLYYHTIPEDEGIDLCQKFIGGNLPFYIKSDIVSHLPVLEFYASKCEKVTELGVRHGYSTVALLSGLENNNGILTSYDIEDTPFTEWLKGINKNWRFHLQSTIDPELVMEETDLMFFDTVHTYEHLSTELKLHSAKAKRFLAFHDTVQEGITNAIKEYIETHVCKIVYKTNHCNGLIVLEI